MILSLQPGDAKPNLSCHLTLSGVWKPSDDDKSGMLQKVVTTMV